MLLFYLNFKTWINYKYEEILVFNQFKKILKFAFKWYNRFNYNKKFKHLIRNNNNYKLLIKIKFK